MPATKSSVTAPGRFTHIPPGRIIDTTDDDDDVEEFDSDSDNDMASDSGQSEDLNAGLRQRIIQVVNNL